MTTTQPQLANAQRETDQRKRVDAMMAQIRASRIPMPVQSYQFMATRRWRIDLAWLIDRVALELDDGRERDREKVNELNLFGWAVLEVTPAHIRTGQALQWVLRALPECVPLELGPRLPRQGRRAA